MELKVKVTHRSRG